MKFCNELNHYMELLDCSPKKLSEATKLSPTMISRYLNDKRTPRVQSEYLNQLVDGLFEIAEEKGLSLSKEEILHTLSSSIAFGEINFEDFVNHFNILLLELKINISEIANSIGYDTSFISKIKNRSRKPADLEQFIDKIGDYVVTTYQNEEGKTRVATLLNCSIDDLWDNENYKRIFTQWITSSQNNYQKMVQSFLAQLDTFNLNDYIGTDFEKIKVPTSPIILRNSKIFYGPEGRKNAEAEFLKTTLLSKSKDPIFFYSDLPIAETAKDDNFKKKWVVAMTMLLKKGLHLNMVHTVDRPIHEMLLGLENWIPIYMTGSISPYYFTNPPSNLFSQSHCTSGSIALSGECIQGNLEQSMFYLTTKKEELDYYKEKSKYLLSKAKPLMTIYKETDKKQFEDFIKKEGISELQKIKKDMFKNIDFSVRQGKWVMIHKLTSPEIHFVIYHAKLRNAIENFLLQ